MNTTTALLAALRNHPDAALHIILPDDDVVPAHFHVTEIGRVQKDFIDCGGTPRTQVHCQLQLLVANDTDHRLTAGKLAKIFDASAAILRGDELPIVIEHEDCRTIAFPLRDLTATDEQITFRLDLPHPACLAADACGLSPEEAGVAPAGGSCCTPGSGCC
ncbi:DUF6428 family protein [Synoicihabitans lomoniglobus]|uniref:DUF6428 family protein n=1 Tax=Synoicihabitans lomoniglobus TaxID=2909285 RepID=A0AAF0A178_9BACT|nr:DUF6428 family protein [Opitutaceae bacterium LMO-M01]WED64792.1 DUF6428 family protein [Opitutaceae bacterium LMO-M01]